MRKKIYHAKVYYNWRTIRFVKGVEKPSKKWNKANHTTCITEIEPEDLQKSNYFMKTLKMRHKSTNDIDIKIYKIEVIDYLCMSNDVY